MTAPVRTVFNHLATLHIKVFAWFWAILAAILFTLGVVLGALERLQLNLYQMFGQSPPKYFLLVMGILTASILLPVHVANGITRRDFSLASGAFFGLGAMAFGALALVAYGAESLGRSAAGGTVGWLSLADAGRVMVATTLTCLVWTGAGWLFGATFYRFGAWRGIALIPLVSLPLLVIEVVFGVDWITVGNEVRPNSLANAWGVADLPFLAAVGIGVVTAAGALAAAFLAVRDVPVTKVPAD